MNIPLPTVPACHGVLDGGSDGVPVGGGQLRAVVLEKVDDIDVETGGKFLSADRRPPDAAGSVLVAMVPPVVIATKRAAATAARTIMRVLIGSASKAAELSARSSSGGRNPAPPSGIH